MSENKKVFIKIGFKKPLEWWNAEISKSITEKSFLDWCDEKGFTLCFEPIEKSDKLIKKKSDTKSIEIVKIRQAFADYVATEGCSCCRDIDGHEKALKQIATLLKMKKYKDGSGYDYSRYKSKELK